MFYFPLIAFLFLATPVEDGLVNRIEKMQVQENGLFLDRSSDSTTVSSAATGFGALAMAHAADRGLIEKKAVGIKVRKAFETLTNTNPDKNKGWLSHFTNEKGVPKSYSEVSTIDTALFYMGMLKAAHILNDEALMKDIKSKLEKVDVQFVLRNGTFLHGFNWKKDAKTGEDVPSFIEYRWEDSSEGVILYKLFKVEFNCKVRRIDYPLFVYSYPLVFFDDQNYEKLLNEAVEYQNKKYGHSGVTSTDGPKGYTIYDKDLISPLLLSAVGLKNPQALDTLRKFELDPNINSFYIPSKWVNKDDLTIDIASSYILHVRWEGFDEKKVKQAGSFVRQNDSFLSR